MSRLVLVAWLAELASCTSSEAPVDPAKIDTLEYTVPAGWRQRDLSSPFDKAHEWKPDGENERRESLVVSRVAQPALANSRPHLRRALVEANSHLPRARFAPPTSFVTHGGLPGLRVEGTFTPPNQAVSCSARHRCVVS